MTLGALAALMAPRVAHAGGRVALIIGNSDYATVPALRNPARDAAAMSAAFRQVGFDVVTTAGDLNRERLVSTLQTFAKLADSADWAVIYYAGHGIELGGINYLIPVDAQLATDRDAKFEAIALDQVLESVSGAKKLRLVILDACRDNPFLNRTRQIVATRSIGRGLARIEPQGGTLVAYAARDGQVALDGSDANSPFVASMIRHMVVPGIELSKLFRLVRNDVLIATGNRQEPFVYGSLPPEDFYFVPPASVQGADPDAAAAPAGAVAIANLAAGAPSSDQAADTRRAGEVTRAIQSELRRIGCYSGPIDANWSSGLMRRSRATLVRHASISVDIPTGESLERLKLLNGRICPLTCSPREIERNGVCVAKTCPDGSILDRQGTCVKRKIAAERPPASRVRPVTRLPSTPGTRCFNFGGRQYCE